MSQTIRQRRALTQRTVTGGIGDLRSLHHASNDESLRASGMLVGAILWTVFVLFCAVLGIVAADWFSGVGPFSIMTPPGVCP